MRAEDQGRPLRRAPPPATPATPATPRTEVLAAADPPLHLVFNRGSGDAPDQALQALIVEIGVPGRRRLCWHPTHGDRTHATATRAARAARDDGGVVVAVGGDGTVSAVAHEAVAHGVPMAVLPAGTFNLFARAQGLPLDPHRAAQSLLSRQLRHVAVGRAGERVFVVSASLGLHPDLIDARELDSRRFGRDRRVAWLSAMAHLWGLRRRLALQFDLDGQPARIEASTVLVSNNPVQLATLGARVPGAPGDDLDALRVLVMPPVGGRAWLPLMWHAMRGMLRDAPGVAEHRLHVGTLLRRGRRSLKLAVDGELVRVRGPLTLRFEPGALRLLVPVPAG